MKIILLEESIGRTSYLIHDKMRTVVVSLLICLIVHIVSAQKDDLFNRFESAVDNLLSGSLASKKCQSQLELLAKAYKNGKRSRASDSE